MAESLIPTPPARHRFRGVRAGVSIPIVLLSFFALLSLACGGVQRPEEGEGPGGRPQRLALSPREELELGRKAYREVLGNPGKYGRVLPADNPDVRRVRAIVARLLRAYEIEPLQREMNLRNGYHFEWEANVLNKNVVNAFCLPGGKVFVYEGILRVAQDDDQIAVIVGHEMAHALAHHTSERIARDEVNHGSASGFWSKSFDRAQESEADHIGLFLMTFAGYNPEEAVRFWRRMEELSRGREPPEILSDHPSDEHRIRDIEAWVPKALAAKKAYDQGNIAPPRGR